jgi:hypothetical protein
MNWIILRFILILNTTLNLFIICNKEWKELPKKNNLKSNKKLSKNNKNSEMLKAKLKSSKIISSPKLTKTLTTWDKFINLNPKIL